MIFSSPIGQHILKFEYFIAVCCVSTLYLIVCVNVTPLRRISLWRYYTGERIYAVKNVMHNSRLVWQLQILRILHHEVCIFRCIKIVFTNAEIRHFAGGENSTLKIQNLFRAKSKYLHKLNYGTDRVFLSFLFSRMTRQI